MVFLVLAFYLSVLTYYLGVLLYMLPIPLYSVKKWAPQLMVDGVLSAILVFSYSIIKWIIDYMGRLLGVDWSLYYAWLTSEIGLVTSFIIALKMIGTALSSVGLNFLANSLISPLVNTLTYLLIFLISTSIMVSVIVTLSDTLLASGVLLHSIPFRLTRASGSTLIALVIVFSIGTPLMPLFIYMLSSNPGIIGYTGYGFALANIYVYDTCNTTIPLYLYEIYDFNNTLLARYLADVNGLVNASSIEKGIPATNHIGCFKLAGYTNCKVIDSSNYALNRGGVVNVSFRINNLISLRPLRFITIFKSNGFNVTSKSSTQAYIRVNASQSTYMVVVGLLSDTIVVYVNGYLRNPSRSIEYDWGGVGFKAYNYTLNNGLNNIYVNIEGSGSATPEFEEVYYARDFLGLSIEQPSSIIYPVALFVFKLFIAPVIYYSILLTATFSLARLLGGSHPRIVRVMVGGL